MFGGIVNYESPAISSKCRLGDICAAIDDDISAITVAFTGQT